MTKKQYRQKLQLKNGVLADARHAVGVLEALRAMQRVAPEEFNAVVAIAQGRGDEVSPRLMKSLKEDLYLFKPDGKLSKHVADVIESSLAKRDNSWVLLQPFDLKTDADKQAADGAQKQNDRAFLNILLGRDRPGPSRG